MGRVHSTGIHDVAFLRIESGLVVEIHEYGGSLVSHQALGDGIFLGGEAGLLVDDGKDELNVVLLLDELVDFVRARRHLPDEGVRLLECRREGRGVGSKLFQECLKFFPEQIGVCLILHCNYLI